jgi:hypothetical protein
MFIEQLINFEIFILKQQFFENNTIIVKVAKVVGHVN